MNVRTLCLGILSFEEASGYEIKKMVEDGLFSHFIDASYGSIYPALTQMLKEGLVSVRAEEQSGKPDKKVYAITAEGQRALNEAVNVEPKKDKYKSEFLFQMLLMERVSPRHLIAAYDKQLDELRAEFERIGTCCDSAQEHPGTRFVNGYGHAVLSAAIAYMEENRAGLAKAAGDSGLQAAE